MKILVRAEERFRAHVREASKKVFPMEGCRLEAKDSMAEGFVIIAAQGAVLGILYSRLGGVGHVGLVVHREVGPYF